jgi:hypothetical protein
MYILDILHNYDMVALNGRIAYIRTKSTFSTTILVTMQTLNVTRKELCRRFWDEIQPAMRAAIDEELRVTLCIIAGTATEPSIRDGAVADTMAHQKILSDEIDSRVKEELYTRAVMHFSCPTRFAILYCDCLFKHAIAVKRERLGRNARRPLRDFEGHDVEKDIELTRKEIEAFKQSNLQLERQFLAAMDENRLDDARTFLSAIEIARRDADETLRNEVSNWRFELACARGDIDMFFRACEQVPSIALTDRQVLHMLIEKLLYNGVIRGALVQLNAEGLRSAARASKNQQEFGNEQAILFLRSVITEIGDLVIKSTCTSTVEFKRAIMLAFERSRKSSLAVNPYLATLDVAWK